MSELLVNPKSSTTVTKAPTIQNIKNYLLNLQDKITQSFEDEDEAKSFEEDLWENSGVKGHGRTRVLNNGAVFESAGVNFSHVYGDKLPQAATLKRPELADCSFQAMGVSIVVHPLNPYVPTSHANVRFFEAKPKNGNKTIWWFGGGFDLTPYYPFKEDCIHWHQVASKLCAPFGSEVYAKFKTWCDNYFYLKHRKETRGIGGLFFDDLNEWSMNKCFQFIQAVGNGYLDAYIPIVQKRKHTSYGTREKDFQLYRRGRYVEFNLLYDRGTLFGIQSNGRTESILMSMPPNVNWRYNAQFDAATPEGKLTTEFLKAQDWLNS